MPEALINRLRKNDKHLRKWARRTNIDCYRIFDRDIPEFSLSVDRYLDCLYICIFQNNNTSEEAIELWVAAAGEALEVPTENIYVKERKKIVRSREQYEKFDDVSRVFNVNEGALKFKVNLSDYLDTGLFLDHRPLRNMFGTAARDKKVLNLFSYTGSFSVYAAVGGAISTTTVDLSNTYMQWAKDNFKLNKIPLSGHDFVVKDVMDFLKKNLNKYDLVIVDPPSFSNSTKLKGTWDTQRDHPALLSLIAQRLDPAGVVYFSNNFRGFQPQFESLPFTDMKEITNQTIPQDFRNKGIHKTYRFQL